MRLRSIRFLTLLALVVSLPVHVTAASALQGTAELRAISCCHGGCEHAPARGAARCCGVERENQALQAAAPIGLPPVSWVGVVLPVPLFTGASAFGIALDTDPPRSPGVPVFLLTQTLRI